MSKIVKRRVGIVVVFLLFSLIHYYGSRDYFIFGYGLLLRL